MKQMKIFRQIFLIKMITSCENSTLSYNTKDGAVKRRLDNHDMLKIAEVKADHVNILLLSIGISR